MGAEEREAKAVIVEEEDEDEDEDEDEEEIHRDGTLPASEPARPLWALPFINSLLLAILKWSNDWWCLFLLIYSLLFFLLFWGGGGGGGGVQKISSELLNLSCWNWVQWCITVGWSVMWKYWDAIFKVTVTAAFVANKYNILCTSLTYQSYVNNHVLLSFFKFYVLKVCCRSPPTTPPRLPRPQKGGCYVTGLM